MCSHVFKISLILMFVACKSSRMMAPFDIWDQGGDCPCGITEEKRALITNGPAVADMRTYPWLVSIHHLNRPNLKWGVCGGSLIKLNMVMTAAHCLAYQTGKFSVDLIRVAVLSENPKEVGEKYEVWEYFIHPEFVFKEVNAQLLADNDIAVIKLKGPVPCTPYSRPICISPTNHAVERDWLIIAGWGLTSMSPMTQTNRLRDGESQIVDSAFCDMFGADSPEKICINDRFLSCAGDSGGPGMMVVNGRFYAVGVMAGGSPICLLQMPSYLTRVSYHYMFLRTFIQAP